MATPCGHPTLIKASGVNLYVREGVTRGPHSHAYPELIYLVHGPYTPTIDRVQWAARPGDVFYYPAGTAHYGAMPQDGSTTLYMLQWAPPPGDVWPAEPRHIHDGRGVLLGMMALVADLWMTDAWAARERPGLLDGILDIVRYYLEGDDFSADPVARVQRELERQIGNPAYTLGEIARTMSMTAPSLCRLFARRVGVPPMRYLRDLRVRTAVQLIKNTTLPLPEIAARVGIPNLPHLRRLIGHETGASWRALRS